MSKERLKQRVYRCKRCGHVSQTSSTLEHMNNREDRCPDPSAPGGYWYCDYIELVPKKARKVTK